MLLGGGEGGGGGGDVRVALAQGEPLVALAAHAPPYARLLPKKNEETVVAAVEKSVEKLVVADSAQE